MIELAALSLPFMGRDGEAKRSPGGVRNRIASVLTNPTLAAAPPVPPHEGEEGSASVTAFSRVWKSFRAAARPALAAGELSGKRERAPRSPWSLAAMGFLARL